MKVTKRGVGLAGAGLMLLTAGVWLAARTELARHLQGKKTVGDRLAEYGPAVRARLAPDFQKAGVAYPPARLTLVGLKKERRLEVYAAGAEGEMRFVRAYPILAASGGPGPKLQEGDGQVPEGVYGVESLNPNSRFHFALRIGYPNAEDRAEAAREGRTGLGEDIMIHGSRCSVGCLAMGDRAAEDLFVLAGDVGPSRCRILLCPADLRRAEVTDDRPWVRARYAALRTELSRLPAPNTT